MVKVVKKSKSELLDENNQLRQTVDDLRKTVKFAFQ